MDAVTLATLLASAVKAVADYKRTRDELIASQTVTHADSSVMSNKDLIALFKGDARSLEMNAQDLIDKYKLQPPQ
jgi:hypothetical protein